MKILHIIPNLNSGGAEKMLVKILENDTENENIVITLFKAGFYEKRVKELNVDLVELELFSLKTFFSRIPLLFSKCREVDLIHSWMYYSNIFSLFLKFLFRKRIVWNIRRSHIEKSEMKSSTYYAIKLNSLFAEKADMIIYNSYMGKKAHEKFGFKNKDVIVLPNGFEKNDRIKQFSDSSKELFRDSFGEYKHLFCNVARWEPLKDHKNLLEAMSILKYKNIDYHLLLCGKNIDYKNKELVDLLECFELGDKVTLLGERTDIEEIMNYCDLYISSSRSEGFPNVLGEAMKNNLLVVTTDAGDSKFIIQNDNLIVPVNNPIKLADKICSVLSYSEELKTKIINDSKERVNKEFNIEKIVLEYNTFYKGVTEK